MKELSINFLKLVLVAVIVILFIATCGCSANANNMLGAYSFTEKYTSEWEANKKAVAL